GGPVHRQRRHRVLAPPPWSHQAVLQRPRARRGGRPHLPQVPVRRADRPGALLVLQRTAVPAPSRVAAAGAGPGGGGGRRGGVGRVPVGAHRSASTAGRRRFVPIDALKVVALVDGEHYPAVTRWGLATARADGYEVLAALVVGGVEKLDAAHHLDLGEVTVVRGEAEPMAALRSAIERFGCQAVLDLSDEPVLGYERRMELVAVALASGVAYMGADFRFEPPIRESPLAVPTVGVIGTGKRVAKTGLAG